MFNVVSDTVYHKSKTYVQKKLKERAVKDKATERTKRKAEKGPAVKTKEEYLNSQKEKSSAVNKGTSAKVQQKNYIEKKLKTKAEYQKMQAEEARISGAESGNTYFQRNTLKAKQRTGSVSRSVANTKSSVKTRRSLTEDAFKPVKSGSAYAGSIAKKRAGKGTKVAVKTQKEVTKKAAKETAKQAKEFAQKTVVTAKKTAQATVRAAVKVAQLVAKAAQAFISAIAALGGWAILVVILIVISIVASIVASPFGIFISDEAADIESIPISSIINECNIELSEKLEQIEDDNDHDRVELTGEPADWGLILSLFAVKVAGTDDDTAEDVVVIDEAKKQRLKDVFWDTHTITSRTETVTNGETSEIVLYITITAKTKEEMIEKYSFTRKQKEALETLLENDDSFISAAQSLAISDATAQDIISKLPDSLSEERKQVVKKACSLVGKVTYFWGGKSSAIGWDSNWGKMTRVTAEGSRTTGTVRPFGLDCSGFVTWSFHNAGFSESQIGHGAATQAAKGTRISWASAKPGDLALYNDKSHIGIVAGKDSNGNILVIHCASGANNVVVTTNSGFGFCVRPNFY